MPQSFNFAIFTFNHLKILMGNSFGTLFRISSWGESHGGGIGVVIDGCPPRLPLGVEDIQPDLTRRRPVKVKSPRPGMKPTEWKFFLEFLIA
jgi:chorismate synthase